MRSTYSFNAIVTSLVLCDSNTQDPKKFVVEFYIDRLTIPITASRINVQDFKLDSEFELPIDTKELCHFLDCGLPISVKYDGHLVGVGTIQFPSYLIEGIGEEMEDLVLEGNFYFERRAEVIGRMAVKISIRAKRARKNVDDKSLSPRQNMINKNDICFFVGPSGKSHYSTSDVSEETDFCKFGIQRFGLPDKSASAQKPCFCYNPIGAAIRCELKKMEEHCENVVNKVKVSLDPGRSSLKTCSNQVLPNEKTGSLPCLTHLSARSQKEKDSFDPVLLAKVMRETNMALQKSKKFCRKCLADITYLPQMTACPNCGFMPKIVLSNEKEEDNALNWLPKPKVLPIIKRKIVESRCKCSATSQPCARCRVVEKCADIYKPVENEGVTVEYDGEENEELPNQSMNPNEVNRKDDRPFLSKVFSELRVMHNIKGHLKKNKTRRIPTNRFTNPRSNHVRFGSPLEAFRVSAGSCKAEAPQKRSASPRLKPRPRPPKNTLDIKKLISFMLQQSRRAKCFDKVSELLKREHKPLINLRRVHGELYVTLSSQKSTDKCSEPLKFKLVKSPLGESIDGIKHRLLNQGFTRCTCYKPIKFCKCRDINEKRRLGNMLQKECQRRGIKNCSDRLVLTDSSENDLEFDLDVDMADPTKFNSRQPPSSTKAQACGADLMQKPYRRSWICSRSGIRKHFSYNPLYTSSGCVHPTNRYSSDISRWSLYNPYDQHQKLFPTKSALLKKTEPVRRALRPKKKSNQKKRRKLFSLFSYPS